MICFLMANGSTEYRKIDMTRLLSLWFHFDDCHQGMVSEPPRDPFSDAKLATQKLFEMDWKCQDGVSLLYFTHYVRHIVEKMGSHRISRYESSRM